MLIIINRLIGIPITGVFSEGGAPLLGGLGGYAGLGRGKLRLRASYALGGHSSSPHSLCSRRSGVVRSRGFGTGWVSLTAMVVVPSMTVQPADAKPWNGADDRFPQPQVVLLPGAAPWLPLGQNALASFGQNAPLSRTATQCSQ